MAPTTSLLALSARLSDADLLAQVPRLAACEREATVALIAHLAELDARRLYLAAGCASLFTFCTQVLHLSEHAAYGRIEAARTARRYPLVLDRLTQGAVTLTTVVLLAPHLTPENHRDLLDRARHRSKREVEALVASLRPVPPVPASVRRLPAPAQASSPTPTQPPAVPATTVSEPRPAPPPPVRPAVVVPLAPESYRVQFMASAETHAKLRLAQDLLRHQIPDGDVAQVLDLALTVLVETLTRQKLAATTRPREGRPSNPRSRHIPSAVRRAVWARDGGRCAFVSKEGRRCTERGRLEFHHVRPYAMGGPATVENIQLRCQAHNGYEAERVFGPSGPWSVREQASVYAIRRPPGTLKTTRSGPSSVPSGRPP